jgi:dTDP-4-amino-4,6-dideoxygalactose transaminase
MHGGVLRVRAVGSGRPEVVVFVERGGTPCRAEDLVELGEKGRLFVYVESDVGDAGQAWGSANGWRHLGWTLFTLSGRKFP